MPKVVTRATVSTSEDASKSQSARAVLRSYYCLCGDFLLVLQGKLDRLPRRRTDGAFIIRSQPYSSIPARKFKLNAEEGDRVLLTYDDAEQDTGGGGEGEKWEVELRQNFVCSRCRTPVAYQTSLPPAGNSPFLYIIKGAMTET